MNDRALRALWSTVAAVAIASLPATAARAGELKPLPVFQLPDVDGHAFSSTEQLADKTVVLLLWRPGQDASRRALRDLTALAADYDAARVKLVGVVRSDVDRDAVVAAAQAANASFPLLRDREDTVYGALDVSVSPTVLFADRGGAIRFRYAGHRRDFAATARTHVDLLLGTISTEQHAERLAGRTREPAARTARAAADIELAHKLLRDGRRAEAEAQLEHAWNHKPRSVRAAVDLGILSLADRRDRRALAWFDKALDASPQNRRARAGKGVALIRRGRTRSGLRMLRAALDAAGDTDAVDVPLFYYEAGVACEHRDDKSAATRYFRRGLELVLARRPDLP